MGGRIRKGFRWDVTFHGHSLFWGKKLPGKKMCGTQFFSIFSNEKECWWGRIEAKWCLNWPSALGTLQAPVRLGLRGPEKLSERFILTKHSKSHE